jgi:long-chain acyl-CoA synthetase
MQGYWEKPEESAKVLVDGWLHTGDVAVMDAQGYLKIVDRIKDMIIVSGFKVFPNEVEDCISKLEGVLECAVIGVDSGDSGEAVRAYVVCKKGVSLTLEQVREHCKSLITSYKVPKQVKFVAELPKTPIGKILRKDLKSMAKAEAGQAA